MGTKQISSENNKQSYTEEKDKYLNNLMMLQNSGLLYFGDKLSNKSVKGSINETEITSNKSKFSSKIGEDSTSDLEQPILKFMKEKDEKSEVQLVLYKFIWTEGGIEIYIIGTFANWNQKHLMTKCENGSFEADLVPLLNKNS
jgi:hypothetical protein